MTIKNLNFLTRAYSVREHYPQVRCSRKHCVRRVRLALCLIFAALQAFLGVIPRNLKLRLELFDTVFMLSAEKTL